MTTTDDTTVTWERISTAEYQARRQRRLIGLITRPAPRHYHAHRIVARDGSLRDYGPSTKHSTLTAARAAIERDAAHI